MWCSLYHCLPASFLSYPANATMRTMCFKPTSYTSSLRLRKHELEGGVVNDRSISFRLVFKHAKVKLAQDEKISPVTQGVAAGFQVGLRIDIGLATAGVNTVLGNYSAVPSVTRACTQTVGVIIDQWQTQLGGNVADDLVNFTESLFTTATGRDSI